MRLKINFGQFDILHFYVSIVYFDLIDSATVFYNVCAYIPSRNEVLKQIKQFPVLFIVQHLNIIHKRRISIYNRCITYKYSF